MRNKFKKVDANGESLPEEIGKGINEEHLKKVIDYRHTMTREIVYDDVITFKINSNEKIEFFECFGNSTELRNMVRNYIKNFKK